MVLRADGEGEGGGPSFLSHFAAAARVPVWGLCGAQFSQLPVGGR